MGRLIDASDVKKRGDCYPHAMDIISNILRHVKTVKDAVVVVRCKDCKWSIDLYNDGDCYCERPNKMTDWHGNDWNFFCKDGERKEQDDAVN